MKSVKYRNTIIISIISLAFVCAALVFAYNLTKSKSKEFISDGYVLNTLDGELNSGEKKEKSEVQHFSANTKYQKGWDGTIDFKNEKGDTVKANAKGFLYYNNNDLETIDKAVLLDTNDIDNGGKVASYSMPEGTIIKSAGAGYELTNLEETIKLEDYIWKVDESKYLIVSDQIEVLAKDEKMETLDKFVELSYVDEGIVRLTNDKYNYQTILADTKIKLNNNAQIDLNSKDIDIAGKQVTNLAKMLVDSSDNVEIVNNNRDELIKNEILASKKEAAQAQENAQNAAAQAGGNSTNNSSSSSSNTGGTGGGGGGGVVGGLIKPPSNNNTNNNKPTQDEDEEERVEVKFKTPEFKFNKWQVSAIELDVEIEKIDEDNILTGDAKIIIFEKAGDTKLPEETWASAEIVKSYRTTRVKPNTDYVLQVQGQYKVGVETFSKVFLEKEFRTDGLGVGFDVKSAQLDATIVNVTKEVATPVSSATMVLYDPAGEEVAKIPVDFSAMGAPSVEISFDSLAENTRYTIVMESLLVGRETIDRLNDGIQVTTLKKGPTIGKPIVKIDKVKQTFELSVDNIADHSGGVKAIVYKVFSVSDPETAVVEQRRDATSSAVMQVDGTTLQQGEVYTFQAVVEYYDNEKVIEYSTVMSQAFSMSGLKLPEVKGFELGADGYTRFESIKGYVRVANAERTIEETIQAEYTLTGDTAGIGDIHRGSSTVTRDGDDILIPIEKNGLRAGQSYTLSATVGADLLDGSGVKQFPLQSVTVSTSTPQSLKVAFTANTFDPDNKINFTTQLSSGGAPPPPTDPTIPGDYEATTMDRLVFKVYRGSGDKKEYKGDVAIDSTNSDPYVSSLKTEFYDQAYTVKDEFFKLLSDDLQGKEYTIVLDKIYDYTSSRNEITISGSNEVVIKPNASKPSEDELKKAQQWSQQSKAQASDTTVELEKDTIVAGAINYNFPNELPIFAITTRVYVEKLDGTHELVSTIEKDASAGGTVETSIKFKVARGTDKTIDEDIANLKTALQNPDADGAYGLIRGLKYRFDYDAQFDLDHDGTADYKVTTAGTTGFEPVTGWVKQAAQINKQAGTVTGTIAGSGYEKPATAPFEAGHVVKYQVDKMDYDEALAGKKIILNSGATNKEQVLDADSKEYTIKGFNTGLWKISGTLSLNKSVQVTTGTTATEKTINLGTFFIDMFTDINKDNGNSYVTGDQTGRFHFTLSNMTGGKVDEFITLDITDVRSEKAIRKIGKVEVKFKEKAAGGYQGTTWVEVPMVQGKIQIPYSRIPRDDLAQLKGKEITLEVRVVYDTGEFQAKNEKVTRVMMQEPYNQNGVGRYYNKAAGASLFTFTDNAAEALQREVEFADQSFMVKKEGETDFSEPYQYSYAGSTLLAQKLIGENSNTAVWFKKAGFKTIDRRTTDTNVVTLPEVIIPVVRAKDEEQLLDKIAFTSVIDQANSEQANKYTVELYRDATTLPLDMIGSLEIAGSKDGIMETPVVFGGKDNANMLAGQSIAMGTTYVVKVKGEFEIKGVIEEKYLLDASTGNAFEAKYTTKGDVFITDITYAIKNRKLVVAHRMSPASVLEKVEYVLEGGGKTQTITKGKSELGGAMNVEFPLSEDFPLGVNYKLTIKPYSQNDSNTLIELLNATANFDTLPLEGPRLSLTYSSEVSKAQPDKAKLDINFTVSDSQASTENIEDAMTLQLTNEAGQVINTDYTKVGSTSPTQISGKMATDGLEYNTEYILEVKGKMDSNLDGKYEEPFEQSYRIRTIVKSGISVGDITLGVKANYLNVTFQNSNNLVSQQPNKGAKTVQYTLRDGNGVIVASGTEPFRPISYSGGKIYTYKIDYIMPAAAQTYQLRLMLYDAEKNQIVDYNGTYMHNYD